MKTAEEILKSKLDGKITFVNNPDYTFNKVIEAMEEYRLQSHPSPMSASDMTAREYFDGEGSPLTLSKICNDEEKEFLLQHIELYASGKVHQSKQPPMSAEQVDWKQVIKDRVNHFNDIFHTHEAKKLLGALHAIEMLVPPSHFATTPPNQDGDTIKNII